MKIPHSLLLFCAVLLAATGWSLGCKSHTPATVESGTAQNATGQPATATQTTSAATTASSQPGTTAQATAPVATAQNASLNRPAYTAANSSSPAQASVYEVPSGTAIRVRLDTGLSSKMSQTGDPFSATVAEAVQVNGVTVIEKGAPAEGTVVEAKSLGRVKGEARLALKLERVRSRWGTYPVATSTFEQVEKGKGKRSTAMIGGGAALGALIGGLAGGGKGAAIGGLAGAGAGTAGATMTGNKQIVLPAGTLLSFRLAQAVSIQERR